MNDLLEFYSEKTITENISETFNPAFWFRLDKDTSWIIVAAKTYDGLQYLNKIIRDREVDKTYLAIVSWAFPQEKIIDMPIFKWFDSGFGRSKSFVNKEKWLVSKTKWNCLKVIKDKVLWDISLVRIKLYTGRMHQIRVHLSYIWYPILWDITYWNSALNRLLYKEYKINRQLLHSYKYSFYDKFKKKKVGFESLMPNDFEKFWFII
jgi:23S rRNA pseudouridine955/2504/2580 synthase